MISMMPAKPLSEPYSLKQWFSSQRRVRPLTEEGRKMLYRVTEYLWTIAQDARTEDEYEDFKIGLYILGAIRQGWASPVLTAYYYACGVHPYKFKRYRLERHARMEWELAACSRMAELRRNLNRLPPPHAVKHIIEMPHRVERGA